VSALLSQRPLFALGYCDRVVPASTPGLQYVKSWRESEAVYCNRTCARCKAPKPAATETLWCAACHALPACDECGMPEGEHSSYCGQPVCWGPYRGEDRPYTP
jgi:hypothetical protein